MKHLVNNNQQNLILMLLNLLKSKHKNLKIYSLKTKSSGKQMVVMMNKQNLMKEEERSNI